MKQAYSLFAAVALGALLGCAALLTAMPACTPAQVSSTKQGARTVLNVTEAGCAVGAVVGAIVLTDAEGQALETVCADEEELRPLIDRLLASRRARAYAKAKALGVPTPDAAAE